MQVNATLFRNFLSMAAKVANGRVIEVYSNVRLKARDGKAEMFATDGSNFIKCSFEAEGDIDCLLPVSKMTSLLADATEGDLTLEFDGSRIKVMIGKSTFKLGSSNPSEFPAQEMRLNDYFTTRASALCEALRMTEYAADESSSRYQLAGVFLDLNQGTLECVATDGRRLATMELSVDGKDSSSAIVPTKAVRSIIQFLSAYPDDEVKVTRNESSLGVEVGGVSYITHTVEGRYPQWRNVIPDMGGSAEVQLVQSEMLAGVRKASILLSSESSGLDVRITPGNIHLVSKNETGDGVVELMSAYDGPEMQIRIDFRFFIDVLRVARADDSLVMEIKNSESPLVIKNGSRFRYVVMPMARL